MKENKTDLQAAEVQLIYKSKVPASKRVQIKNSKDAHEVLWNYWNKETIEHHEEFVALLLNNKNHVLGIAQISKGGITSTIIDAKIVLQYALKCHATGLILAHNHPSSDPTPSESDVATTRKLMDAGNLLNIQVLDHLVITGDGTYYSLADEGRL
jgi:DNA repair protein RadC